jgi:MYXO-CTERM domain-containing protein
MAGRSLNEVAGLAAAAAALMGLRAGWKVVTGSEPPAAPDDKQVPVGQVVAWGVLSGAAAQTVRMVASRYVAGFFLPRQPQAVGQADGQSGPQPQPQPPGLVQLVVLAVLAWRRRR